MGKCLARLKTPEDDREGCLCMYIKLIQLYVSFTNEVWVYPGQQPYRNKHSRIYYFLSPQL